MFILKCLMGFIMGFYFMVIKSGHLVTLWTH